MMAVDMDGVDHYEREALRNANTENFGLINAILAQTAALVRVGDILAEQVQLTKELVRAAGETVTEGALDREAKEAVERYLAQRREEAAASIGRYLAQRRGEEMRHEKS